MAIFHIISVTVPAALAFAAPYVLQRRGYTDERKYRVLLYAACVLFAISWYLPSPLIDGKDTAFVTHFIGGGVFTGLFWVYLKRSLGWKSHWLIEVFSLYALVSALGCINELAELFMVQTGIARILLSDTNWDILANTSGALIVWALYVTNRKIN